MLAPRRSKYRYRMRGKIGGKTSKGASLDFGEFGLKAMEAGTLTSNQIESARRAVMNATKRSGKLWIRVFPDKPITAKAPGVRMGKGKGDLSHYAAVVRPGRMVMELSGVGADLAQEALKRASHKLPIKTKFITS